MIPLPRLLLLVLVFSFLLPLEAGASTIPGVAEEAAADTVVRVGRGDPELDRRIDALLETGGYLLITNDTLIGPDDTVKGTLLVLGSTLILEGRVTGDLVEVAANVFIRPRARVDGDLVNIGGGLYPSSLATVGGATINRPLAPYRVEREGGVWRIEGVRKVDHFVLDGFLGFHIPTYQRVDALGIRWGASYLSGPDPDRRTRLHGWVGYMTGRGALEGGAELSRRQGATTLSIGAAEETATNDRWNRGDLRNSFSFLQDGDDYRNYYLTRRAWVRAARSFGRGPRSLEVALRGQLESDRSMKTVSAWTLVGGSRSRPNPPIDEGEIAGVALSADGGWIGERFAWEGFLTFETAGRILGGDYDFNRMALFGDIGLDAFRDHALFVKWYFQGPVLGSSGLPRQRWSILGGNGVLSAYDIGEFRGDRVAFAEARYVIPLPERWSIPILGRPYLELAHAAGSAWIEGEDSDLAQSIEARLRFSFIYIYLAADPADPSDQSKFSVGLSWPFGDRFPWRS